MSLGNTGAVLIAAGGVGSSKFISVKLGMALKVGVDISMSKSVGNGKSDKDSTVDSGNGIGDGAVWAITGIGSLNSSGCGMYCASLVMVGMALAGVIL